VYLVNDVIDLKNDRQHPVKKRRPIAGGRVSVPQALVAAGVIASLVLFFSYQLNIYLGHVITGYIFLNLIYSGFLKHKVIVDIFCLAAFFLLRLAAGSVVADVELSQWIVCMTFLLVLFLGFGKRRQELGQVAVGSADQRKVLSQYNVYFIDQMISVVTSSIVIVYMLYTVDPSTVSRFGSKHLIATIPFVYYGIFRYLYLIHKEGVDGDPTQILLSDLRIQVSLIGWILACVGVIYFGW
jgi:4-hydroxybenzoate polyprenyltransferase